MTMMLVIYQKKLYRILEREQSQVFALFEYATEGIILTNGRGEMILVNPEAERLFGFEKAELLRKPIELLIPQRFLGKHEHYREQFNHKPSNRRMGQGRDLFARRKNGTEFPVEKGNYAKWDWAKSASAISVIKKNSMLLHLL